MRNLLIFCICVAAAYCVDRNYYGGAYGHSAAQMLRQIIVGYK
jgi:hypothetical protein